jgi:hypothetical protein
MSVRLLVMGTGIGQKAVGGVDFDHVEAAQDRELALLATQPLTLDLEIANAGHGAVICMRVQMSRPRTCPRLSKVFSWRLHQAGLPSEPAPGRLVWGRLAPNPATSGAALHKVVDPLGIQRRAELVAGPSPCFVHGFGRQPGTG